MYWTVVYTQPRCEKLVAENLSRQNFVFHFPLLRQHRVVRGKKVTVLVPLFPRYLLTRIDDGRWSALKGTRGVQKVLTIGDQPAKVPQKVIDELVANETEVPEDAKSLWVPGDTVKIITGAFAGLLGIYERSSPHDRQCVLLNILGRSALVEVPTEELACVPASVR